MSDYWKKFGEELKEKHKAGYWTCTNCGTLVHKGTIGGCPTCAQVACSRCGNKFSTLGKGWRKICPDCVGERGSDRKMTDAELIHDGGRIIEESEG
jgi:hypothetical protein